MPCVAPPCGCRRAGRVRRPNTRRSMRDPWATARFTGPWPSPDSGCDRAGRAPRLFIHRPSRRIACLVSAHQAVRPGLAGSPQLLELFFGQMLDPDVAVLGCTRADEFVKLRLDGSAIAILRVLDE